MFLLSKKITSALLQNNIQTRPNAGHGLWLILLLPVSLIASTLFHPIVSTAIYKTSAIISFGLVITSIICIYGLNQNKTSSLNLWLGIPCFVVTVLLKLCLHKSLLFCLGGGITCSFIYQKTYKLVLTALPKSLTLGEAAICSQSYVLLLFSTIINVLKMTTNPPANVIQASTFLIQISLIGLSAIIYFILYFQIRKPVRFYAFVISALVLLIFIPATFALDQDPVYWILTQILDDLLKKRLVLWWGTASLAALLVVARRVKKAKKANTAARKIFHILCVAVFIPGIIYNCSLIYLASGLVLAIFFLLEFLRCLRMPPFGQILENGVVIFLDEKDSGLVALTPLYLLCGCAVPLWIHPAPCDVTNSGIFQLLPLLSGVLTTGIGDMAASVVGSKYGRHFWNGSKKTIEGTLACIISQQILIYTFVYFDFMKIYSNWDHVKIFIATVGSSLIEAKTDQVDNLVLPFIMYLFFIFE